MYSVGKCHFKRAKSSGKTLNYSFYLVLRRLFGGAHTRLLVVAETGRTDALRRPLDLFEIVYLTFLTCFLLPIEESI